MQVVAVMLCLVRCVQCNDPETASHLSLNFELRAHPTISLSHAIYLSTLDKSHPIFLFHFSFSISLYRWERFLFLVLSKLFFFLVFILDFVPNASDARLTYCAHAFLRLPFLSMIIFFRSISDHRIVIQETPLYGKCFSSREYETEKIGQRDKESTKMV